ncbi:MAG: YihY/virulence factor BrkB family protein [Candidatus Nanopelagicales bacterium]|nr:YihY/virulence factor BrkB family protein [Candidatus Nanopelagicales bacterium]
MKEIRRSMEARFDRMNRALRRRPVLWWLVCVVIGTSRDQSRYRISLAAAGVAFWLLIALFPAILAVVSIFGLVVEPADLARDLDTPRRENNGPLAEALHEQLQQFMGTDTNTLSIGLVVSTLVLLWTASALLYAASRAIRVIYELPPVGYFRIRLQCVAGAAVMVIVLGVLVIGLSELAQWLESHTGDVGAVATGLVEIPMQVALLTVALVALIRFSVGSVAPVKTLWLGTVAAAVVLQFVFRGFGPYIAMFGDKSAIYGAAAGVVVAMLLAWVASYVVLLAVIGNTANEAIGRVGASAVDPPDWTSLADEQRVLYRERLPVSGRARRR